jgi:hypothetical protein
MRLSPAEIEQIAKEVEQAKIDYQWKKLMQEIEIEARHDNWGDRD